MLSKTKSRRPLYCMQAAALAFLSKWSAFEFHEYVARGAQTPNMLHQLWFSAISRPTCHPKSDALLPAVIDWNGMEPAVGARSTAEGPLILANSTTSGAGLTQDPTRGSGSHSKSTPKATGVFSPRIPDTSCRQVSVHVLRTP